MKNYILYIVLAAAALVGCTEAPVEEMMTTPNRQTLNVSLPSNDDLASRISMTDGDSSVELDWQDDDLFTVYSSDGERITDFKYNGKNSNGSSQFITVDEGLKLSDGAKYIAIYPAVEAVETIEEHRAELKNRIAEQIQTGNDDNSHIDRALRLESEFVYSIANSSIAALVFEHKTATVRVSFSTIDDAVPDKLIFEDGDFMSYTLNFADITKAESYTANLVIEPNEAGESRTLKLFVLHNGTTNVYTTASSAVYSAGVQYRSRYDVSIRDRYISTKEALIDFRDAVNKGEKVNVVLLKNIDLGGMEWIPIRDYSGVFNGGGYAISNFTINNSGSDNQGFFGSVNRGTIISLTIKDATVVGRDNTAALCGYFTGRYDSSIIENCGVEGGSVKGGDKVGGIVGSSNAVGMLACYNTASVEGGDKVGGIVGYATGISDVIACYNTGSVSGVRGVGGVVGYAQYNIRACYNTGSVEGSYGVGGVAGYSSISSYRSYLSACYNTGSVEGVGDVGGVAGYGYSDSAVADCYYLPYSDLPYGNDYGSADEDLVETMKSADFPETLSIAAKWANFEQDVNNYNNGYPILSDVKYH